MGAGTNFSQPLTTSALAQSAAVKSFETVGGRKAIGRFLQMLLLAVPRSTFAPTRVPT
jgi:hypothetical protein